MIHIKFVFVVALFLCSAYSRDVGDILQDLQKYCPFYAFDGSLYCPTTKTPIPKVGLGLQDSQVLSGLGYDSIMRQIRFPVLPSTAPVSAPSQTVQTYKYTDVSQYISAVYAEKSSYEGGLFVLGDNFVNQFASIFANYQIDMAVTQKQYNTYATKISSNVIIPEFQELLDTLPPVYDPNNPTTVALYRERIINIFGTDVSVASTHGGIFYQQSVVKACYGADITTNMVQEITTTIAKLPPGPLAYLNYRSLGVFDVKGGNPEIPRGQYPQIIASFPLDPAITSFTSVPLWSIVPANYQAAVKAAIAHYIVDQQVALNSIIANIEAQKIASYKKAQSVYVYGQQTEQFGSIIHWTNCPFLKEGGNYYTPRCTIPIQTVAELSGAVSTFINTNWEGRAILHYESQRDLATGVMRIVGTYHPLYSESQANITVDYAVEDINSSPFKIENSTLSNLQDNTILSPWDHTGCVSLGYLYLTANPNDKVYFTACIDCLPVVVASPARYGLKHSDLQCVCPGF